MISHLPARHVTLSVTSPITMICTVDTQTHRPTNRLTDKEMPPAPSKPHFLFSGWPPSPSALLCREVSKACYHMTSGLEHLSTKSFLHYKALALERKSDDDCDCRTACTSSELTADAHPATACPPRGGKALLHVEFLMHWKQRLCPSPPLPLLTSVTLRPGELTRA